MAHTEQPSGCRIVGTRLSCLLPLLSLLSLLVPVLAQAPATAPAEAPGTAPRFANGLPGDPMFFPLGVWLQSPDNARRYRDLGINLYVGLWQGPTQAQLDALDAAGMRTLCEQNEVGLAHRKPTIQGWMLGDEPDNAQGRRLTGYKPPLPPWQVVETYEQLHRRDPTRPVLLNLGQGAAWDGWHGRGERSGHPEDYPEYLKGCDLVSFDIYPVTHAHRSVHGKLEFVGRGVQRLRSWGGEQKPVWACIETARIGGDEVRPTPEQVRSEVWIAICCGASGIVYFAHEFAPTFIEAGLLHYPEIAAAVRATNTEVLAHANVLHSPLLRDVVQVTTEPSAEIAVRAHHQSGALHLFAASLHGSPVHATFTVKSSKPGATASDGDRALPLTDGAFSDDFASYGFRHYRVQE